VVSFASDLMVTKTVTKLTKLYKNLFFKYSAHQNSLKYKS